MDLDRYSTEIFWDEDDQGFIALAPDLPGCSAFGISKEEALRELHNAMQAWIEAAQKAGNPIPQPARRPEFSGKFMVRMSKSLHAELVAGASDEGVSLNQHVVTLLSRRHEASAWKKYLDAAFMQRYSTFEHHLSVWASQSARDAVPWSIKTTSQRTNDPRVIIFTSHPMPAVPSQGKYHG